MVVLFIPLTLCSLERLSQPSLPVSSGKQDQLTALSLEPGTERRVGILGCLPSGAKEKPTLAEEFRALGIMLGSDLGCLEHRHSPLRRVDSRVWAWLTRVGLGW